MTREQIIKDIKNDYPSLFRVMGEKNMRIIINQLLTSLNCRWYLDINTEQWQDQKNK